MRPIGNEGGVSFGTGGDDRTPGAAAEMMAALCSVAIGRLHHELCLPH